MTVLKSLAHFSHHRTTEISAKKRKVIIDKEYPRTGPLRMGEVVVEDLSNGQIHRGADDIELIARNIPAYLPLRLLLKVPGFRRYVSHEVSGNACAV